MRVFFIKEISGTSLVDLINDASGDEVIQELILQVKEDASITLKGSAIDNGDKFTVSAIAQNGLSVVNEITSAGLYIVPVEGMSSLELTVGGNASIVVKAIG